MEGHWGRLDDLSQARGEDQRSLHRGGLVLVDRLQSHSLSKGDPLLGVHSAALQRPLPQRGFTPWLPVLSAACFQKLLGWEPEGAVASQQKVLEACSCTGTPCAVCSPATDAAQWGRCGAGGQSGSAWESQPRALCLRPRPLGKWHAHHRLYRGGN